MILLLFVGLQVLDLLTTLLFLRHGVAEGNPMMRAALAGTGQPGLVLALAKAFAIALAAMAWRTGRKPILRKVNLIFAGCVAWNVIAILVGYAS